jgi:hypothetical protein
MPAKAPKAQPKAQRPQKLVVAGKRFVIIPEKEFLRLEKAADGKRAKREVNPAFADAAMRELRAYKRTRQGRSWDEIKRELAL